MQNIKSKEKKIAAKEIEKAEKSEAKKKSRIKWFFSRENIIGRRVVSALICIITVALWEFGVHLFVYQKILVENLFLLAFSVPVGIVVSILFSLFPKGKQGYSPNRNTSAVYLLCCPVHLLLRIRFVFLNVPNTDGRRGGYRILERDGGLY